MDALLMLEFPPSTFDLVNQRFGVGWLRMFEWEKILMEYHRVTRPRGVIRITEGEMIESNSLALTKLCDLLLSALYYSGRFFTRRSNGITQEHVRLIVQHGIGQVQKKEYRLAFKGCTPECEMLCENIRLGFRTWLPFFHRWIRINSSEYEELYAQALRDIQQPNFVAQWPFVTVGGSKC